MSSHDKVERDEVTINIGMPRPLHRRLSITCAVMDVSLKAALVAGAALWIDENAHAVATALPGTENLGAKARPKGDRREVGASERLDDGDEERSEAEIDASERRPANTGVPRAAS